MKEIIFWEGIFISCLSTMSHVLSQLFHFILFSFNHPQNFIYLNRVPLFCTFPVAWQWASWEKLSPMWLCSSTYALSLGLRLNDINLYFLCNSSLAFLLYRGQGRVVKQTNAVQNSFCHNPLSWSWQETH